MLLLSVTRSSSAVTSLARQAGEEVPEGEGPLTIDASGRVLRTSREGGREGMEVVQVLVKCQ